jgi:hypothetical protein
LEANRYWRSFSLRQQGKRAKQKQGYTNCGGLSGHIAPRLTKESRFGQRAFSTPEKCVWNWRMRALAG